MKTYKEITGEDIANCWEDGMAIYVLKEILKGEKTVEEAREDLIGLIGSKYDLRTPINRENEQ